MNIWMFTPIDCKTTPTIMIMQPTMTPIRRPQISAMYGVIGSATIDPTDMMAFRRPRVAGLGLLKAIYVRWRVSLSPLKPKLTLSPLGQGLETIHHTSIITVGSRSKDCTHKCEVHSSHTRFLPPWYTWEFSSTNLKGQFGCGVERHRGGLSFSSPWSKKSKRDGRAQFVRGSRNSYTQLWVQPILSPTPTEFNESTINLVPTQVIKLRRSTLPWFAHLTSSFWMGIHWDGTLEAPRAALPG